MTEPEQDRRGRRAGIRLARFFTCAFDLLVPAWFLFERIDYAAWWTARGAVVWNVAVSWGIFLAYQVASHVALSRSVGQFVFEVASDPRGRRTSLVRGFWTGVLGPVDELLLALSPARRSWIDRLSGSTLVDTRAKRRARERAGAGAVRFLLYLGFAWSVICLLTYLTVNVASISSLRLRDRPHDVHEIKSRAVGEAGWETVYLPGFELQVPFAVPGIASERSAVSAMLLPGNVLQNLLLSYRHPDGDTILTLTSQKLEAEPDNAIYRMQKFGLYPEGRMYRAFWAAQPRRFRMSAVVANVEGYMMKKLYAHFPLDSCATHHRHYSVVLSDGGWEGVVIDPPGLSGIHALGTDQNLRYHMDVLYDQDRYLRIDARLSPGAPDFFERLVASLRRRETGRAEADAMRAAWERYAQGEDADRRALPAEFFLTLAAALEPGSREAADALAAQTQKKRSYGEGPYGVLERYREPGGGAGSASP